MDLHLLTCFIAVADELHFGRAAQSLDMLPSALGRNIRLLEEELGTRLFTRSTRSVALTRSGHILLPEARNLIAQTAAAFGRVRAAASGAERVFRIGAIDSAAIGLIPALMHDLRELRPELEIALVEDKTAKLLPKLLSGSLDIAFVRPPLTVKPAIEFHHLLDEPTIVALPPGHPLGSATTLSVADLADVPLIVPSPRSRPHSYNLTMRLFVEAGLAPNIVQQAEEKQTIVNLVAAGIGAALVPYWTSRVSVGGVTYRPLHGADGTAVQQLPLAAAWVRGVHDAMRDAVVKLLNDGMTRYAS